MPKFWTDALREASMHGKTIEEINDQESQENPFHRIRIDEISHLAISFAAEMPEFTELMAAIDVVTSGWHFDGMIERLVKAKKDLMAKVKL